MRSGKRMAIVLAAVGAAFLVATGCGRREIEAPRPIAVQVAALKSEPITSEVHFSATVRERHRLELSFKVPGTVAAFWQVAGSDGRLRDVHEGDAVSCDPAHPLARLDDSDYKRRLETTEDRVAQAQAKRRAAMAGVTAVRANFERIKGLRERGSVAQQTYDDMLARKDSAEAELEAAGRETSAANVARQQAEDDWKNCTLRLPIPSGIVSRKYIESGERVPAGQPVFQIMDLAKVRVAFGVPDTRLEQFQPGQTVTVMADALRGERFTGRVSKVLPAADPRTRSFEVEVTIDEPKALRPGMVVTIVVGRQENVVLVPMTAVRRGVAKDDFCVYVVADEDGGKVARARRICLGGVYDNRMRLVEGTPSQVGVGDMIVTSGSFRLTDGQAVRVLDVPSPALRIGD
jgi:RND family efflux transporter MFP subunit